MTRFLGITVEVRVESGLLTTHGHWTQLLVAQIDYEPHSASESKPRILRRRSWYSTKFIWSTPNWKKIYDEIVWFYTTVSQVSVFDANDFFDRISPLVQLTRRNIPYWQRFDQMIYTEQNSIIQNLSEHDICIDRKDLIDRDQNAMNLYNRCDSKGQTPFISSTEGLPWDHDTQLARNVLNQQKKFPAYFVSQSNEIWNILDKIFVPTHVQLHSLHAIQQYQW